MQKIKIERLKRQLKQTCNKKKNIFAEQMNRKKKKNRNINSKRLKTREKQIQNIEYAIREYNER